MVLPKQQAWFALDSIDLTGIGSLSMMAGWQTPPQYGYDFEIRLDEQNGKLLGTGSLLSPQNKKQQFGMVNVKLQPVTDGRYHTVYVVSKEKNQAEKVQAGLGFVQFNSK